MRNIQRTIIPIWSDVEFETLCCIVAQEKFKDYNAQKYGRKGQKQWGIDIKAIDFSRDSLSKIVIQCKFKENPNSINLNILKKELEDEIKQAKDSKQFDFDEFIFATTCRNNSNLINYACELETKENKKITIWFWEDLERDILTYPRLTRLYTENNDRYGVEIINQDFIDNLDYNYSDSKPDIFRFFSGQVLNNVQWYGIRNKWDVARQDIDTIKKKIDELTQIPYLQSKVILLVSGEGGSGKSTLLRRLTFDNVLENKPYINWWIENIDVFLEHDKKSIDDSPNNLKHLLFIEDWYRNIGNDKSGKVELFFQWLKYKSNVFVIIGDRNTNKRAYNSYLYDSDNQFELKPSENSYILKQIGEENNQLHKIIEKVLELPHLYENASLFIILFVLANLYEDETSLMNFDIRDIKSRFRDLIARKLYELEIDENYKGLGKALYLCAKIYANEKFNYFNFSDEAFLHTASHFGKNSKIKMRIRVNNNYPEQVNSLIQIVRIRDDYVYFRFNHDIIAEEGIIFADKTKYAGDLKFNWEYYDLIELTSGLREISKSSTIIIYLWLFLENQKDTDRVNDLFERIQETIFLSDSFLPSGIYYLVQKILDGEKKKVFLANILKRKDFLIFPYQIVSTSLKICQNEEIGKEKAKAILGMTGFLLLPKEIISTSLKICQNEEIGKEKAKEILGIDGFLRLPKEIVSTSLKICQNEEIGKEKAKAILGMTDFLLSPYHIVSTSLNICKNEEIGKEKAKEILGKTDFLLLPYHIVSTSLNICQNEEIGKEKAKEILGKTDFLLLPYQIVSTSLNICQNEEIGKEKAKEILRQEKFFKLPPQIVTASLKIFQNDNFGKEKAKHVISISGKDIKSIHEQIISVSLKILGSDLDAICYAKTVLFNHRNVYSIIILFSAIRSLAISNNTENLAIVKEFYTYLDTLMYQGKAKKNQVKLYYNILQIPLFDFDLHRKRVLDFINEFKFYRDSNYKFNIGGILNCFSQYSEIKYYKNEVQVLCENILENWENDLKYQFSFNSSEIKDYHIIIALSHPELKKIAYTVIDDIIRKSKKNEQIKYTKLYNRAILIKENNEFLEWGENREFIYDSDI